MKTNPLDCCPMKFVGIETVNMDAPYELWYGADSDGDFEEYARCDDKWYVAWHDEFDEAENPIYLEESRRDAIGDSIASETQTSWDTISRVLTSGGVLCDTLPCIRQYFIAAHPLVPRAVERDEMVRDMRYGGHNFDDVFTDETNFDGVQCYGFVNIFSNSYYVCLIGDDDKFWLANTSDNWGHYGSPCVAIVVEAIVGRDYVLLDGWWNGSAICNTQLIITLRKHQKTTSVYWNPEDGRLYKRADMNTNVTWKMLSRTANKWQKLSSEMMEIDRENFNDQIMDPIPFEDILEYAEQNGCDFENITAGVGRSGDIFDCGSYSFGGRVINITRLGNGYYSTDNVRYSAPESELSRYVAFRVADDLKNEKIKAVSDYMME